MARARNIDLSELKGMLPPVFLRKDVEELFKDIAPGMFTKHAFEHYDSKGTGPKRFKMGKRIAYKREDFISWFESRMMPLR